MARKVCKFQVAWLDPVRMHVAWAHIVPKTQAPSATTRSNGRGHTTVFASHHGPHNEGWDVDHDEITSQQQVDQTQNPKTIDEISVAINPNKQTTTCQHTLRATAPSARRDWGVAHPHADVLDRQLHQNTCNDTDDGECRHREHGEVRIELTVLLLRVREQTQKRCNGTRQCASKGPLHNVDNPCQNGVQHGSTDEWGWCVGCAFLVSTHPK